jgi:hypothetical protein
MAKTTMPLGGRVAATGAAAEHAEFARGPGSAVSCIGRALPLGAPSTQSVGDYPLPAADRMPGDSLLATSAPLAAPPQAASLHALTVPLATDVRGCPVAVAGSSAAGNVQTLVRGRRCDGLALIVLETIDCE